MSYKLQSKEIKNTLIKYNLNIGSLFLEGRARTNAQTINWPTM
jgi:hypothetical protein